MDGGVLSGEMKLFAHQIYELQKGIRCMALCTIDKNDEAYAVRRLQRSDIEYMLLPVNTQRVNIFFGRKECINIIRMFCNRPLNQLTPEEDFIIGTLLGYDVCQQCNRYCQRKVGVQSA